MVSIHQVSAADIPHFNTLNHACDAEAYGAFEEWTDAERAVMLIENDARKNVFLVAEDGDAWVGLATVHMPKKVNADQALIYVQVLREAQGKGVGTALAQAACQVAREHNRKRVMGYGYLPAEADYEDPDQPAVRLAKSCGLEKVQDSGARGLNLPLPEKLQLPKDLLHNLTNQKSIEHQNYHIELWQTGIPERDREAFCDLKFHMVQAIPRDDLEIQAQRMSVEELIEQEERRRAMGFQPLYAVARASGGKLVGYTELGYKRTPTTSMATQQDTFVEEEHRGHGLGLLLKRATHSALPHLAPAISLVMTWNAASNQAMQHVNNQLGYRLLFKEVYFQGNL